MPDMSKKAERALCARRGTKGATAAIWERTATGDACARREASSTTASASSIAITRHARRA